VEFKGETDLVTEVDHACELAVVRVLKKDFPDYDFLLEETGSPDTGSPYQWVVDPLDATTNYTHGYPHFCCSIALRYREKTVLGAVFDPYRAELFTAVHGQGAFLNGTRISVSNETSLIRCMMATGFPYDIRTAKDTNLETFCRVILEVRAIRRSGCAALDLCYIASGRLDGYWVVKLAPWDVAAGALMVREAGGKVTDLDGGSNTWGPEGLAASNGRIHEALLKMLRRA
jgi:myo-inositol-1(or 4)-monophosphatase